MDVFSKCSPLRSYISQWPILRYREETGKSLRDDSAPGAAAVSLQAYNGYAKVVGGCRSQNLLGYQPPGSEALIPARKGLQHQDH